MIRVLKSVATKQQQQQPRGKGKKKGFKCEGRKKKKKKKCMSISPIFPHAFVVVLLSEKV